MRLSLDHGAICRLFGMEAGLRLIKDVGFDDIDYAFISRSIHEPIFTDDYREKLADTAALLKEIGLGCHQTHSPIPISTGPQIIRFGDPLDLSCPRFADMVRTLEGTAILGGKQSVLHPLATPYSGGSKEYMDFNYAYFKALEPYSKEYGVTIGIENLEKISGNMYKAEWQNELLDRLDSPQFHALVDLGHAAASETTPDEHLRAITRGRVKGLHFHDFNTVDAHIVPGFASTDWDKVAVALAEIGYEGNLTMEVITHRQFPKAIIPTALRFTAETGKTFIRKFEKAKAALAQR